MTLLRRSFLRPEKQNTADAFWKLVIHPTVEEYFSYNRDPIAASNWMANSVGGAIEAAVAVAGDTPGWREREAPALAKLQFAYQELLQGLFAGDGSESEPYGYENFAMQGMSWGMSSLNALGIHPAGAERMVNGFWWPYYVTVRQGLQLDTGDFNGHLTGLPGFAQGAATSGIPELRALYDTGTNLDLTQGVETGHNGHLLEERLGPIDLAVLLRAGSVVHAPAHFAHLPLARKCGAAERLERRSNRYLATRGPVVQSSARRRRQLPGRGLRHDADR